MPTCILYMISAIEMVGIMETWKHYPQWETF